MPIYVSGTTITSASLNNLEAMRRFIAIGDLAVIASSDKPFDYFLMISNHVISAIDIICPLPASSGIITIDLLRATSSGGTFTSLYSLKTKPSLVLSGGDIAYATFTGVNLPDITSLSANDILACKIVDVEIGAKDLIVIVR